MAEWESGRGTILRRKTGIKGPMLTGLLVGLSEGSSAAVTAKPHIHLWAAPEEARLSTV